MVYIFSLCSQDYCVLVSLYITKQNVDKLMKDSYVCKKSTEESQRQLVIPLFFKNVAVGKFEKMSERKKKVWGELKIWQAKFNDLFPM